MSAKRITFRQIEKLQRTYGAEEIQELINSGSCWKFNGCTLRGAIYKSSAMG